MSRVGADAVQQHLAEAFPDWAMCTIAEGKLVGHQMDTYVMKSRLNTATTTCLEGCYGPSAMLVPFFPARKGRR